MFLQKSSVPREKKKVTVLNCGICGKEVKLVVARDYPEDLIRKMASPVCKECKIELGIG
ncbi:MAG: hypothetical protein WCW77_00375 [Patescibacteria group bacterium]|jgi:hypothetical protein